MSTETTAPPATETEGERAFRQFTEDTREHKLTVVKDDGLYRHLRFSKLGTGEYHFDLVTWPGHLAATGDMGSLMFARLPDMIEFFHTSATRRPDLRYWAEKLTVGRDDVMIYSADSFRRQVQDQLDEWKTEVAEEIAAELDQWTGESGVPDEGHGVHLDAAETLAAEVSYALVMADEGEHEARRSLDGFKYELEIAAKLPSRRAITKTFEFHDAWEWDFREYTYGFQWICHAIAWGVRLYLAEGGKVAYPEKQWMDDRQHADAPAPAETVTVAGGVL